MCTALPRTQRLTKEDEELVPSLYEQIQRLKNQNSSLVEKNKELQDVLEKKKRELAVSKKVIQAKKTVTPSRPITPGGPIEIRPGHTTLNHTSTPPSSSAVPNSAVIDQNQSLNIAADANLLEIAKKYKSRLAAAEEQLVQLREQNAKMQLGQQVPMPQQLNVRYLLPFVPF